MGADTLGQTELDTDSHVPSPTHLLAATHGGDPIDDFEDTDGTCYFCGHDGPGVDAGDAISAKYFSDYNLRGKPDSGHVCASCAYCMSHRGLKQGHWIVTTETHRSVSTGDLREELAAIRTGEYTTPIAVHVSENPIRSEHAYLWTPVVHSTDPLILSYGKQRVTVAWDTYDALIDAVEELRWHGFRGVDIQSGEPRVSNLGSVGSDRYRQLDAVIDPHRGTPLLDVVWTVSRSRDDQPEPPADQ